VKSQISPVVAIIAILVVVGIAAFALFMFTGGGQGVKEGEKPPGMPPEVAEKFRELGNRGPGGPGAPPGSMTAPNQSSGPGMTGPGGMPPGAMGGTTAPNQGR
jgi:hypothetical protein